MNLVGYRKNKRKINPSNVNQDGCLEESKKRVAGVCVYDNEDNQDSDWRYLSPKAMRLCIAVENRRRRSDCELKLKKRRRRSD